MGGGFLGGKTARKKIGEDPTKTLFLEVLIQYAGK